MINETLSKSDFLKYKKLLQKKYRYQYREFIIEGKHLIEEAAKHKNLLKLIITSDEKFFIPNSKIVSTSYENICKLSTTKTPQEYVGICNFINYDDNDLSGVILILDGINDPGNLGTIIRTSHSFGLKEIVVNGVDIYNSKVLRSTQGSIFNINITNVKDIEEYIINLKMKGYKIIGSLLKDAIDYNDVEIKEEKFAIVLGNEANGISESVIKLLDYRVYIPIKFESLNVAVANGILLSKYLKLK